MFRFRFRTRLLLTRPPSIGVAALAACVALIATPPAGAQAPAADAAQATSPDALMTLVGPIALYPDDLVAIILPSSTFPLQLVQADRFLTRRKTDPTLAIDDRWDDSVKSLVNYPEVVKRMSDDLDWTTELGEAVVANQGAVLDAVQAFRRKAHAAGNLKSDPKQVIEVESAVIKIVPADPQVIYVPQYNPTTVVTYSSVPAYGYYPAPYPSYYYPYAQGAALATGLIWGAAIGAAWNGGHYGADWHGDNNITINRSSNISGSFNRAQTQRTQATAWRSDKRPGQVSSGAGRTQSARFSNARPGDPDRAARSAQRAGEFGAADRGAADRSTADRSTADRGAAQRAGERGAGARSSSQRSGERQGAAAGTRDRGGYGGGHSGGYGRDYGGRYSGGYGGGYNRDALGGYRSGNATRADSARGAASRTSMSGYGGRSFQGGRAGGGGRGGFSGGRRGGRGR